MGLDMYLHARKYESRPWVEENQPKYDEMAKAIQDKLCFAPMPETESVSVEFRVMYWRKANAIHGWFVKNCGDGVDECQEMEVTRGDLIDLRDLCAEVVELFPDDFDENQPVPEGVAEAVEEKLSPRSGFFFGSTGIDYWYYRDIVRTRDTLTKVIEWDKAEAKARSGSSDHYSGWWYTYRASW